MTDTTITLPDCVFMVEPTARKTAAELAQLAAELLAGMPQPRCLSIYPYAQQISLGFGGDTEAVEAMAQYGARAGEPITGEKTTYQDKPAVRCGLEFTYSGARVEAYAYVKADQAT
jgi:hypothetical protein